MAMRFCIVFFFVVVVAIAFQGFTWLSGVGAAEEFAAARSACEPQRIHLAVARTLYERAEACHDRMQIASDAIVGGSPWPADFEALASACSAVYSLPADPRWAGVAECVDEFVLLRRGESSAARAFLACSGLSADGDGCVAMWMNNRYGEFCDRYYHSDLEKLREVLGEAPALEDFELNLLATSRLKAAVRFMAAHTDGEINLAGRREEVEFTEKMLFECENASAAARETFVSKWKKTLGF